MFCIYICNDTHVSRWSKMETRRVSSSSTWPWDTWPNFARVYFSRRYPSCKLLPPGSTHFYRSLYIRPRSRGKRRTHDYQCHTSPRNSALKRRRKKETLCRLVNISKSFQGLFELALIRVSIYISMHISSLRRYFPVAKFIPPEYNSLDTLA